MPANLENSAVATRLKKVSFHSNPKERQCNAKECSSYCIIVFISYANRIMLKILQARLQQYMNCELPDVQAGFRKGKGTRDQIANIHWIIKKQENSRKTSASLTELKPLTVWITKKCEKLLKRWEYRTTLPVSWGTCMQIKKKQNQTWKTDWFKIGKGVCQGCILSLCLFNLNAEYIIWNAGLDDSQAGIKIAGRNINNLRYADDTTLMAES